MNGDDRVPALLKWEDGVDPKIEGLGEATMDARKRDLERAQRLVRTFERCGIGETDGSEPRVALPGQPG